MSAASRQSHSGITVHLVGAIEDLRRASATQGFLRSSLVLAPPSSIEPDAPVQLAFDFGALGLPYESFEGSHVQVRYYVRVAVRRTLSDRIAERTLWVSQAPARAGAPAPPDPPVTLDAGKQDVMQMSLGLDRSRQTWNGIVCGSLTFHSLSTPILAADVCLIRRESIGAPAAPPAGAPPHFAIPADEEFLARHQVMDGPAEPGDRVPFRFHLASCLDEFATATVVEQLYAIRYYLFLVLHDALGHKYYKAHELTLEPPEALPS